jgi:hypothetical protein
VPREGERDPSTGRAVDSSREDKSVLFGRGVRPAVIRGLCGTSGAHAVRPVRAS